MALHLQTFKTRTLTAVVFAVVMLAGLLINKWSFILLFLIIMIGCLFEFYRIIRLIYTSAIIRFFLFAIVYIILPVAMMLSMGIMKQVYIIGPSGYNLIYSPLFPCAIMFSIWINDTMAYIVGSMIGKTPFSKISPKKTWEGTIGGAILCVVVIALLSRIITLSKDIDVIHWIWIATICAVFGTVGDLLESKLKRMAKVKDSGSFMPGHGGFLDRFDSMLVATPFVWLYIHLFFY